MRLIDSFVIQSALSDERCKSDAQTSTSEPSLAADFLKLLSSGRGCDVVLLIKEERIQAHRAILMARSAVFSAMLEKGRFCESREFEIPIDDVDAEAMRKLVHYLYSDQVHDRALDTFNDAEQLLI